MAEFVNVKSFKMKNVHASLYLREMIGYLSIETFEFFSWKNKWNSINHIIFILFTFK